MFRQTAMIANPLALAGCGSGTTVTAENASISEVAEATKGTGRKGQSGEMRMTMAGSFGPSAYELGSEMKMSMPGMGGQDGMTIKTKVAGKRVGACDAAKG